MKRLALLTVALVALAAPADAGAALFFLFDRPTAAPNDRVTVRTGGTPKQFTLEKRARPFQRPVRLYLLRDELVAQVHSRLDARLSFIGSIVPDRNGRGVLSISVPALEAGSYTIAYWCPACPAASGGRTFFVQDVDQFVEPYRSQALLRIESTASCPVTLPNGDRPPGQPPTCLGTGTVSCGQASPPAASTPWRRTAWLRTARSATSCSESRRRRGVHRGCQVSGSTPRRHRCKCSG
jgi:hypothetical protein